MRRTRAINSKAERGYILVFVLGVLMTLGLLLGDISTRSHLGGSILLNSAAQVEKASYFSISAAAKTAFRERCKHYIDVFGASGKA